MCSTRTYVPQVYCGTQALNPKQIPNTKPQILKEESELRLLKTMAEFPDVIAQTAADYEVHRLTRYATELARAFHDFYEKERVIDSAGAVISERLQLVEAARIVLANTLCVLGVSAPEKM